jgi:hypothetical protein
VGSHHFNAEGSDDRGTKKPADGKLAAFHSLIQTETVWLGRTLSSVFIGCDLDGLLRYRYRDWWQKERTIVTAHAGMATYNLEEEEATHFIAPGLRLGRVDFSVAAIRAVP